MEHRIGERVPTELVADIYRDGAYLGEFAIKDISRGGLCILHGGELRNPYKILRVALRQPGAAPGQYLCRMDAFLLRVERAHAGLMWASVATEIFDIVARGLGEGRRVHDAA